MDFNFMNADSFGALGGQHEAGAIRLQAMQAEHLKAETEAIPAHTRLATAQADLEESKAREQRFAASLSGGSAALGGGSSPSADGKPVTLSSQMLAKANLLESGAPQMALELKMKAAQVAAHESTISHNQMLVEQEKQKASFERWDKIGAATMRLKGLPPAQQQAAYEQTLMTLAEDPQLAPILQKLPQLYSDAAPKLDAVIARSVSVKDQLADKARTRAEDERIRQDKARDALWDNMMRVSNAREGRMEAREARLEKQGGKPVGQPSATQLKAAEQSIMETFLPDYPAPSSKAVLTKEQQAIAKQVSMGARENAFLAREIAQKQNVSYDTALAQVVSKQQSDGSWKFVAGMSTLLPNALGGNNKPAELKHAGGLSAQTAVPAPAAADRVVGHYYIAGGKTYQWAKEGVKTGWKEVGDGAAE